MCGSRPKTTRTCVRAKRAISFGFNRIAETSGRGDTFLAEKTTRFYNIIILPRYSLRRIPSFTDFRKDNNNNNNYVTIEFRFSYRGIVYIIIMLYYIIIL